VAQVVNGLKAALDRRVGIEEYLVWSTIVATLMWVPIVTPAFQSGYLFVLLNSMLLLTLDGLTIHRNHLIVLLFLAMFSAVAATLAGTPLTAPVSQLLGITLVSVYFFSALTGFGLPLSRWMELYMRAAFWLAIFAILTWPFISVVSGDYRLRAVYSEPSYFIYVTLAAFGYCVSCFVQEKRYGWECLVFLLSYILADSSLGFVGIMLIAIFSFAPRLKGWQLLGGGLLFVTLVTGLFFASANFRLRAESTAVTILSQDFSNATPSTFALLSNAYVAGQSFLQHPWTGIGIGGFRTAYDKYIGNITGFGLEDLFQMQLNRDDANSMFIRVLAELGIPGLLVLLAFLITCSRVRGAQFVRIRNAILPYLLVRMGRGGHYFTVELYFFVGIYLLNYLQSRQASRPIPSAPV